MNQELTTDLKNKIEQLFDWFNNHICVIAFSGGVDSTTLAKALVLSQTQTSNNDKRLAPTGYFAESSSSTELEKTEARRIASEIGLNLIIIQSNEFSDKKFIENSPLRCYWCKKNRFSSIRTLANEQFESIVDGPIDVIDGTNADDAGDYRPGTRAAHEVGIKSPFAELGFTKAQIRELARYWNLSIAEKPSNPCLATRVAYYLPLKDALLRQIEVAETKIKEILQVDTCRARVDVAGIVRIEVKEDAFDKILVKSTRNQIITALREIGFNFVSVDLEGFYSGKNNRTIQS